MALSSQERTAGVGQGTWTRAKLGLQVALAVVLAIVVVGLLTMLAERRGLRWRADLTQGSVNTLSPAVRTVLDSLRGEVEVDVFFSTCDYPLHQVGEVAQNRFKQLLVLLREESGGHVRFTDHDLSNRAKLAEATTSRKQELNLLSIAPGGVAVVSYGKKRETLNLRGDIADLAPGNADPRQGELISPRIVNFRGEEALVGALLKVTRGEEVRLVITTGHGEPPPRGTDPRGISRLVAELEGDGFLVELWDGSRQGALPASTSIVLCLGPEQPFSAPEYDTLREFVLAGGRLFAVPGHAPLEGPNTLAALLESLGMKPRMNGFVAQPLAGLTAGAEFGRHECAGIVVHGEGMTAQNPITEAIRRAERRVEFAYSRAFERTDPPPGGRVLDLLRTGDTCWYEVLDADGKFDWAPAPGERFRRFVIALQAIFPPTLPVPKERAGDGTQRPESRVLCLGSRDACSNMGFDVNRDLLLNGFNWLASREYHVRLTPKLAQDRRLDLKQPRVLATVNLVASWLLPGLCLALGLFTAWKRRR